MHQETAHDTSRSLSMAQRPKNFRRMCEPACHEICITFYQQDPGQSFTSCQKTSDTLPVALQTPLWAHPIHSGTYQGQWCGFLTLFSQGFNHRGKTLSRAVSGVQNNDPCDNSMSSISSCLQSFRSGLRDSPQPPPLLKRDK